METTDRLGDSPKVSEDPIPVYCNEIVKIPPRSEVIVKSKLGQIKEPRWSGLEQSPTEVITVLEPEELGINGIYVARVINSFFPHESKKVKIPVKLINCSNEFIEIPKNKKLGVAYVQPSQAGSEGDEKVIRRR